VGAREHVLKNPRFLYHAGWTKHFREIPSHRKRSYIKRFPTRFSKIKRYFTVVRIATSINECLEVVRNIRAPVLIIDDKIMLYVRNILPEEVVMIPEGNVQYRHHKLLLTIADNLANYFRLILKTSPRRFREELERFEK